MSQFRLLIEVANNMAARKRIHKITRKRRGLMNAIGAIFAIIILATSLNMTFWIVRQQDKVTQTLIEKQNADLNRLKEDIEVADIGVANSKLNLTITNEGSTRATLNSLYVVNETSQAQYRYDMNIALDGKNVTTNIGQSNPAFTLNDDMQYTVKVVSESGNTVTARIRPVSLSEVALPLSLYVIPSTVTTLENVTLLFSVMNNLTEGDILAGPVTPELDKTLSCGSGPDCEFTDYVSPEPAIISNGGVTFFKWIFKVTAPEGTTMTFNATLANAKEGNYVIETGRVEIVQEAFRSSEVIIASSSLIKPEVYMLSPGPFGDSGLKGYWGVVVVNPVNATMHIKMVAINMFSSTTSASAHILTPSGCNVQGIMPSSNWDCPHDGIIRWQNLDNPITVKGNSSYTFIAKAVPGSLPNGQSEIAFMISISVFTDFGQFSRQGYATNMYDSGTSLANVYLTDTPVSAVAIQDSPTNHIFGNITVTGGILGKRIYVAVADFDTNSGTQINSGATLIINVPKGFPNINIPGVDGYPGPLPSGFSSATNQTYSDGSTQIRAVTNEAIGDAIGGIAEGKVFYFDVDVPSTGDTTTYVMHTFVSGKLNTGNPFPADAFGTLAITVCPDSGCT
jgi:hypothetical protein